jgi:beta-galactosidase
MNRFSLLCLGLLVALLPLTASANDSMFPPTPAAKHFIDMDGKGFLIHGKRTFIVSGSMHYARVPRALWADRLLRMKRAGFNTVQSYLFWNVHEPEKGVWNFKGRADLDAFLKLVKKMGMYATCRVGPYYCAEWDSGGYPVWLRFVPGLRVREPNAPFEKEVGRFFDKLLPIVASNQINHGGSVILVQLENEHPLGWGTDMPNSYFRFLYNKAVQDGIQVPFFFSGLHHSSDPAGNEPWGSAGRNSPWYCTEFWPGWYNLYGALPPDRERYFTRGTWKIIAYGGNGYNYYMLHGGSNFGYTNNDEDAASYDYAGAIGQAGDLRPIYYQFKRAAWFARSFGSILEDSDNATENYAQCASNPVVRVTARTAQAGTLLFLDNPGNTVQTTALSLEGNEVTQNLEVAPGEIRPIILHYTLLPNVTLQVGLARIYAICQQANITTLVVNGPIGKGATEPLVFRISGAPARQILGKQAISVSGDTLTVVPHYPAVGAETYAFEVGKRIVRVLAVSEQTADRTWFVEVAGHHYVILGPRYVGEVHLKNGHLLVNAERPAGVSPDAVDAASCVYGPTLLPSKLMAQPLPVSPLNFQVAPKLSGWQALLADREAAPDYSTKGWLKSRDPIEMGADGYNGAYAWYRTTLQVPKAGVYTLHFSDGGDWLDVFVNGHKAAESRIVPRTDHPVSHDIIVNLPAGHVTLAVLTAHYGRPKRFSYLGPLDVVDVKGLKGPMILMAGSFSGTPIEQWYWMPTDQKSAVPEAVDTGHWQTAKTGEDLFHGRRGYVWAVASLPDIPGAHHLLHFENVDDNGDIYLNGKFLFHHEGWGSPFDVNLDAAWNVQGANLLAVRVQNTDGPGGIMGPVTLRVLQDDEVWPVEHWAMHGGVDEGSLSKALWRPWPAAKATDVPTFYRATFIVTPPREVGAHPILRFSTRGLSRGFVWLNSHNLGRYPEKVPIDGYYLPECWLKPGVNELLVFDEKGYAPIEAHLWIEQAASHTVYQLESEEKLSFGTTKRFAVALKRNLMRNTVP